MTEPKSDKYVEALLREAKEHILAHEQCIANTEAVIADLQELSYDNQDRVLLLPALRYVRQKSVEAVDALKRGLQDAVVFQHLWDAKGKLPGDKVLAREDEELTRVEVVYAILSVGYVKIGKSRDPKSRLSNLASSNPNSTTILGIDTDHSEQWHHDQLIHFHHRGEWFKWCLGTQRHVKRYFRQGRP